MADYIYLLQNRLTPAQWRALETVREAARNQGSPVFLVGGAVRDLTTGTPVRDLDFALQGDVEALIPELESAGASISGRNEALSSLYLTFRGGVRGELGPSLHVSYPKPGQPEAHPAPILEDLRRRDFTANAMAISLNEGSYGLLLDPLNGIADIENRELRMVSPYGFIEQPALLLRAARLGERLGWTLEERTASRYQSAKDEDTVRALPAADRGYELEEIFHEEYPLTILEHMEAEGWRDTLFPRLRASDGDRSGLDHVRDLVSQLEAQGIHPDPSAVYFPLVTAKLSEKDRTALETTFARQGFVDQIRTLERRAKELSSQLTSAAAALPSQSWRHLMAADPAEVLWLAVHVRTGAVQAKIKAFLKDWPQMRGRIPYGLMQEMRITPDLPGYEKLLDDLFFALIDGKLDTPEAARAFLEPYSPPAPPQVAVRRRPAKSARSKKRSSGGGNAEAATDDLDAAEAESETAEASPGAGSSQDEDAAEPGEAPATKAAPKAKPPKTQPEAPPAKAKVPEAPVAKSLSVPASEKKAAAPPSKEPTGTSTAPTAQSAKVSGSKAASKRPSPAEATPAPAKQPAKTSTAGSAQPPSRPTPHKAVPTKPAAPVKAATKSAAKTVVSGGKTSSKAPVKAAKAGGTTPKQASSAGASRTGSKAAPVKALPPVKVAAKTALKKVAGKAAPGKGTTPVAKKSAKKVAAKARKR